MGRKTQLALGEEETLADCVRKYSCLYDKSSKYYKDKYCVENAMEESQRRTRFEEGVKFNSIF